MGFRHYDIALVMLLAHVYALLASSIHAYLPKSCRSTKTVTPRHTPSRKCSSHTVEPINVSSLSPMDAIPRPSPVFKRTR